MKNHLSRISKFLFVPLFLAIFFFVSSAPGLAKEEINTYKVGSYVFSVQPMDNSADIYEFLINNNVVMRYRSMYQGFSAKDRAHIILERAKNMAEILKKGTISVGILNGNSVVTVDGHLFITVTQSDYKSNNTSGKGLALIWARNLAKARSLANNPAQGNPGQNNVSSSAKDSVINKNEFSTGYDKNNIIDYKKNNTVDEKTVANSEEQKMLNLINLERAKAGVRPLIMDNQLVKIARLKAQDMINKNYFDHTSPTYGDPFTMMRSFGVKYGYAGENLAGNQTVDNAHESLMNSPGHRRNILNPDYTYVGIGIVEGGSYGKMFTQLFIGK